MATAAPHGGDVGVLWTRAQSLRRDNTTIVCVGVVVACIGIAVCALSLWLLLSVPANPPCVDPKVGTARTARLQVRVLGSTHTPAVTNQCLTVVPDDGALTLAPCDATNPLQQWTVNSSVVDGVPPGVGTTVGTQTALYTLDCLAGLRASGATTGWRLVSPCAMRSVDMACATASSTCQARVSNTGRYHTFAPCIKSADGGGSSAPPTNSGANCPVTVPPFVSATRSSPEPHFLFNNRSLTNWCALRVHDASANALPPFKGLAYDATARRVVWAPTSDLELGFVSVSDIKG